MNKNYRKALINELFDQNILNSEEDRENMKVVIADLDEDLTGCFDEDVELLKEEWAGIQAEKNTLDEIEKIVNSLHVGFNLVPVIGVGYCKDREDLERMQKFVRSVLTARSIFSF